MFKRIKELKLPPANDADSNMKCELETRVCKCSKFQEKQKSFPIFATQKINLFSNSQLDSKKHRIIFQIVKKKFSRSFARFKLF